MGFLIYPFKIVSLFFFGSSWTVSHESQVHQFRQNAPLNLVGSDAILRIYGVLYQNQLKMREETHKFYKSYNVYLHIQCKILNKRKFPSKSNQKEKYYMKVFGKFSWCVIIT